ncbi:MAG: DNA-directed RNA polymerase subunit omega [Chitinophagaceae bacterium]|jgi:DNA-directed RNA polymerase subunit K/omega|nr:MAG: DNA-directed RNA polymerase subunit omega [Chitinophagaceae bacterium]
MKKSVSNSINPLAVTRDLTEIKDKTGNLYKSIAIIAKRANQINIVVREELHSKLEEFVTTTDNLEEVHENKEQIEISRFYERLPNPALVATEEFLEGKTYYRQNEDEDLFS